MLLLLMALGAHAQDCQNPDWIANSAEEGVLNFLLQDAEDAFERAGSLDKEAVRDAIAETDLMTFYGAIKFSEAGNNIAKPMVLRQIQGGAYNVVAPSDFASHPVNWPRN